MNVLVDIFGVSKDSNFSSFSYTGIVCFVPWFCSSWSAYKYSQKNFSYQNIVQNLQLINTSSQIHFQWLIFQQRQFHWQSEINLCNCRVIHIYFTERLCSPVWCFSKFSALIYLSLTSSFAKLGCIASKFWQML